MSDEQSNSEASLKIKKQMMDYQISEDEKTAKALKKILVDLNEQIDSKHLELDGLFKQIEELNKHLNDINGEIFSMKNDYKKKSDDLDLQKRVSKEEIEELRQSLNTSLDCLKNDRKLFDEYKEISDEALKIKETALNELSKNIDARLLDVSSKEKNLAEREKALAEQSTLIKTLKDSHEYNLQKSEEELSGHKSTTRALADRESELTDRKSKLDDLEKGLNVRAEELEDRKNYLDERDKTNEIESRRLQFLASKLHADREDFEVQKKIAEMKV